MCILCEMANQNVSAEIKSAVYGICLKAAVLLTSLAKLYVKNKEVFDVELLTVIRDLESAIPPIEDLASDNPPGLPEVQILKVEIQDGETIQDALERVGLVKRETFH